MSFPDRLKIAFSIDLRSIALFRMCLGSIVIIDLILRSFDMRAFYTDAGVLTRPDWLQNTHYMQWSLHSASGDMWLQVLLFLIAGLAAFCLALGYRTKLASIIVWILTASLLNRNDQILQGGDQLLAVLTFWAMFLPLNARYSIDSALDKRYKSDPNSPAIHENRYFSIITVAVLLQVLYLYFFTALLKTGAPWRTDFNAAFYAVSLEHFATPIGAFVRQFPWVLSFGTVYVLAVEFIAPFLVLSPWWHQRLRIIGLLLLASLHVGFLLMLHIGLFPFIDFTALSLLIPGSVWGFLAARKRRQQRSKIHLHYDEDCGFCLKTCLLLREFLLPGRCRITKAQADPDIHAIMLREHSWVVEDINGNRHTRWRALQFLFSQSPIFKPIGWLMKFPGLMAPGDRIYGWVGDNRQRLGNVTEKWLAWTRSPSLPRWPMQGLAAFFLVVVLWVNISADPQFNAKLPSWVDSSHRLARLNQRWDMFSPFPLTYSMYPIMVGNLRNGETVDLLDNDFGKPDFNPPGYIYPVFNGYRWRKYLERLETSQTPEIPGGYGRYWCRKWNTPEQSQARQLATIDMNFIRLDTNLEGKPKERSQRRAWQHWCYPEFAPKK